MIKEMIVNSTALETKIAILEDDQIAELYIERNRSRGILGNIYKGRVTKVLPGMQSAFVDIRLEKDAFLYVSDFIEDTEEYDKVLTSAEDQVVEVMAEIETQEPPPRRDRKERPRWRDRRERAEPSRAVTPAAGAEGGSAQSVESWFLSSETDRAAMLGLECGPAIPVSEIPGPVGTPCAPTGAGGAQESYAPPAEPVASDPLPDSQPPGVVPLERAVLRDDGDVAPFSVESGNNKGGFGGRRRGPGPRRKRYTAARHSQRVERQSIGDMLREGQEILVQVAKEPIGKKGARVTSHIALPGRYLVYMPTVDHIGVSRKIASEAERIRLKDVILKRRDRFGGGFIVRTAAEEHSEEDLVNDLNYLAKPWEDLRTKSEKKSAPALIHRDLNLVQRLLRDQLSQDYRAIRLDNETEFATVLDFVNKFQPALVNRVKLHLKDTPIFEEYGLNLEIEKALRSKVWLKSGGYIVINQTEALVAIDVNTGKFVGKSNRLEDTIVRTNVDAVHEIV